MPSFTNNYTEPGTYTVIDDDIVTDVNTGLLSVCVIGTGKTTKTVSNELLELLPPVSAISTITVNGAYSEGDIVEYDSKYYEVTTSGTVSFVEPVAGGSYAQGEMLYYTSTYYQVTSGGTIDAPEIDVDDEVSVGDIVKYNDDYYQITTGGTVTDPVDTWLASNATQVVDDTVISRWLSTNATVITSQATANDLLINYWLETNAQETTVSYPEWTANTDYIVGDLMTEDGSYYKCTVAHTSPEAITSSYLNDYWEVISPIADYYSAQLQANIVNLPTEVVDAISSKPYKNTDDIKYFDINGQTFRWLAPTVNGVKVMPQVSTTGKYSVTANYTVEKTSADREAKSYTRLSSIYAAYGDPSAENTISAGAQIAYDNGATSFYCIQPEVNAVTGNIDAAGLQKALREASKVNTYCILPMVSPYDTGDATNSLTMGQIISACKTHVENMSTTLERKERVVVLADSLSVEADDDIDKAIATYKANAVSASSARVIYITPSMVTVTLDTGTVARANGMYAAAALAGIICNNNYTCGEPISGKTLADVTINDRYTREEKNVLASYGCLVLEGAEGTSVAKIRHALSTATGDLVKSEIKITKIKDVISSTLRLALDRAYINTRFQGASTISEMSSTVSTILSSFLANNDIISYSNLVIAQDLNYPNQVNVSFRIQPSVDVSYILVTFGVSFAG